ADIALLDAVKALIVKSANDMAVAIAEHVAGSEEKFAALMTRKARQIGMAATTFRNPHGLPDPAQVTTARDMLTLAMRLNDDFPRQYKLFSSRTFSYGGAIYRNHNTMLGYYDGMDGLKTGYTRASGFNIVTSVRRNGRHIVGAVFGGSSASARNVYMRAILDRGIAVASTERTRKPVLIARNDGRSRQAAIVGQGGWEPKLVEAPRPAPVPQPRQRPVAADARSPEPQPTTAPQQGTRIEIARVRPVVVAPRQPRAANPPEPAVMRDQAPAAKEPDRPAPGVEQKPTPARTFAAPVVEAATGKVARGSPPSTLQAQAERLNNEAGDRPAPFTGQRVASSAAGLRGVPAPVSAGGGVILQVGAYPSEPEAQRGIAAARTSSSMLGNAASRAEPVTAGGRQLWRARFVGLDEKTAATACNELRRRKIDCLVSRGQ
ncbi:MAG TPA: SPOR domain-containing protein, partial [Hyphomicrobiaceae bacterium]|nr:SPOR domain-containing protein [Hyphomicrobiaceae bacterium]